VRASDFQKRRDGQPSKSGTEYGSGRVIRIGRIDYAIESGEFFRTNCSSTRCRTREEERASPHRACPDGMVHSSNEHLYTLLRLAKGQVLKTFYSLFLDGRDTPPMSAFG